MRRVFLLAGLVVFAVIAQSQTALAHVLVADDSNTNGAIVHITPDDDPVAGEPATIYFDAQEQLLDDTAVVSVMITDGSSASAVTNIKKDGSLITVQYVFPAQGLYTLTFTINSDGKTYVFERSQRIARGVSAEALEQKQYAWAEMLLVASGASSAALAIVAWNRRQDIARQSQ